MATTGLERYQIMQPLGAGAQASTFRAIDRQQGREVAIKAFRLQKTSSWKAFERFERECAILRELTHPGVPAFLDHFAHEESGDFFLVMELVEGQSLRQYMQGGAHLDNRTALHLLRQGLSILGYLHAKSPPVLHRDINPANLMLSAQAQLKLVDFGAALTSNHEESGATLTMMGTPGYIAPEQTIGQAQPSSDLYAFGVSIVAAITGLSGEELPRRGLEVDLEACVEEPELRAFLAKCTAANPSERFESAAQAYDALPQNLGGLPPQSPPTEPSGPPNTELATQGLPHDLEALAQVRNPMLRTLFWLLASIAVFGLSIFQEAKEQVDDVDPLDPAPPKPRPPEKSDNLLASMRSFRERVQPFE